MESQKPLLRQLNPFTDNDAVGIYANCGNVNACNKITFSNNTVYLREVPNIPTPNTCPDETHTLSGRHSESSINAYNVNNLIISGNKIYVDNASWRVQVDAIKTPMGSNRLVENNTIYHYHKAKETKATNYGNHYYYNNVVSGCVVNAGIIVRNMSLFPDSAVAYRIYNNTIYQTISAQVH